VSAIEDQSLGLKRAILTLLEDLLKGAVDSDMGRTFGSCLEVAREKSGVLKDVLRRQTDDRVPK
jgi:hypothetical protein